MKRLAPLTIRVPIAHRQAVEQIARRERRDMSSVLNEMLDEALKMRRIPGIVFADGPDGRVARVGGTGLEVFEIVAAYRAAGEQLELLRQDFAWLSELQLRAALAYAEAYLEEIEERLQKEEYWTQERVRGQPSCRAAGPETP